MRISFLRNHGAMGENRSRLCGLLVLSVIWGGCTFKFQITSQKTALEKQIMGSYDKLEDELLMISTVRGSSSTDQETSFSEKALRARKNQKFNQDDIAELKDKGLLGERLDGTIAVVPAEHRPNGISSEDLDLARKLAAEENRDRKAIWRGIIVENEALKQSDLEQVRRSYARTKREEAEPGTWIQNENGAWTQKTAQPNSSGS